MKQILCALLLLSAVPQGIFAQKIKIDGTVKHAKNGEPLEFVHAVLQTADSSFVAGAVTDAGGYFSLEAAVPGQYRVLVSCTGFVPLSLLLHDIDRDLTLSDILLEEAATALEGVTVSASNTGSLIDKKIIYPSERQQKASANGIELLQQLMLPRLTVNLMENSVSVPGGGELQLRINGVKAETADVIALRPSDVVRIEYHDSPGLRYGKADVVLDYIVRRPETGGNLGLNLSDGILTSWGDNFVNGRINHKQSEFSLHYGVSHRDMYQIWRDNEETFTFADGSVLHRREAGEPGHGEAYWQNLHAAYSFRNEHRMFNAAFRYYARNHPHLDYAGTLCNVANPADAVRMTDRSAATDRRPSLDLYYQQSLGNDQTIVLNAVGTYNYAGNTRQYRESLHDVLLTDVNSTVDGRKYSWIGEAIYEKNAGGRRFSAGLRQTQMFSNNTYTGLQNNVTRMNQGETSVYGEYKGKARRLDYTLGAGLTRSYFEQEGEEAYSYYTVHPRIVLFYALSGQSSLRLRSEVNRVSPSLANLSAVSRTVDSLQIQRGNPSLKPFLRSFTELSGEVRKGLFHADLRGTYEYRPNAIMDEKLREGQKIVQTWNNQKSWQQLGGRLTLRVGPLKDIFQASVAGGVNHYISHGNTYLHRYTNWFATMEGSASYKGFTGTLGLETAWNYFYGETMEGGENMHYLMLGYQHKDLSFSLGMFNPFADNYKQETENRSQYASFRKTSYINETSRMLLARLSYNFSFGRTFKAGEKRLHNADEDSGVMNTGK
ncbi:MAG: carboxypeptidase regulatory-like domain-containing protein [Tannerellaceae bacterium]|jgi:hypothetical protein|nr:carboxypeptidase regulatory-like domain-containing protein [Tannerellaceae bacterium]